MNNRSYFPNYFSIEDILAAEEKVPCTAAATFENLGYLCPENDEKDLHKDTTLNLPIWLAKTLAEMDKTVVNIDVPNPFKERVRDIFEADPKIVDLYRLNPNFYEFGLHFAEMKHRDSDVVRELLIKVYRERFKKILGWAVNGMNDPALIQKLDLSEQRMLKEGLKAHDALNEWLFKLDPKLKPADTVVNLKKRKLLDSESK